MAKNLSLGQLGLEALLDREGSGAAIEFPGETVVVALPCEDNV